VVDLDKFENNQEKESFKNNYRVAITNDEEDGNLAYVFGVIDYFQ